ncbi:MAG: XRE family transcriptional regulator [Oligoflexia bacterium]|nr:XRE family transcriptional regulator [Oligoflexia bacterium]
MSFPNKKELNRARKKLSSVKPTLILPKNAPVVLRLKYDICKEFVKYILKHDLDQNQLAAQLGIDPARVSEIVKYKIELFTVDRLLSLLEKLRPVVKIKVAS